ncbi:hypothetical protein HYT24_02965 [Candidatus Pacearchaeota archaeon]|nr:hypothetical protein [Candidatus Pacearchaeota archaeon]
MATIQQIIGKINPDLYVDSEHKKELLKEFKTWDKVPADKIKKPKCLSIKEGIKGSPQAEHKLIYDSTSETLEPIYFFTIDMMTSDFNLEVEKLVDNFVSTPGSAHFAELGQRATIMQQNASRIMGDVNNVMRSVLNIIYDLREFRIRLKNYDDIKSPEKAKAEASLLSLKQIWLDKVDFAKGNTGIKAMAFGQAGYQTLIDAFLIVKDESLKDPNGNVLDLNERVIRIVKSRIQEFNIWVKQSEGELRKRYELEKTYLRSQVNSLQLYARWAKPYLRAAQQLEMTEGGRNPSLVKTFNTIILELTLLGKQKFDPKGAILDQAYPADLGKVPLKRDYYSCVLVDFKFRGIPQRAAQQGQYVFGGKSEITFQAYALNNDELEMLDKEKKKSDIEDALKLVEGMTTESLEKFQDEIKFFLEEKEEKKEEEKEEKPKTSDQSNPFLALIGVYNDKPQATPEKGKEEKKLVPESWIEKNHIRRVAADNARKTTFNIFDIYKQAHGMPSYT